MKMCFLDIDGILNSGEDHENLKELKQSKILYLLYLGKVIE